MKPAPLCGPAAAFGCPAFAQRFHAATQMWQQSATTAENTGEICLSRARSLLDLALQICVALPAGGREGTLDAKPHSAGRLRPQFAAIGLILLLLACLAAGS